MSVIVWYDESMTFYNNFGFEFLYGLNSSSYHMKFCAFHIYFKPINSWYIILFNKII